MFNYDITKHQQVPLNSESEMEANELRGASPFSVGQQSGDAVIAVFPYADADTFDFETQQGKHISVKENRWGIPSPDRPIKIAPPLFLDDWLVSISVQQTKASHQGALIATVLDPRDELLAKMSPGDWIVCWMFDNKKDGNALRTKLLNATADSNSFRGLNGFKSGLKFIGKLFSIRKNLSVNANGARTRRVKVMAFSFTELDSGVYFDPELAENKWRGTEYMVNISAYVTGKRSSIEQVGKTLGEFITVFLGKGLVGTPLAAASPMRPIRVPAVIGSILGKPGGSLYIDILNTHIGIQQYTGNYMPDGLGAGPTGIAASIRYTPNKLTGYVNPVVSPFNNTPIWGLLHQFSNPIANEMFASLRMDNDGNISPTLTIRQIPFNTEEFTRSFGSDGKATAFRSLPRWVVNDTIITDYSLGKTDALRVNFVRIIPVVMDFGQRATSVAARAHTTPTSDIVDYERNGLRAKVASINTIYGLQGITDTHVWTHNITDREMGGHLKLSGSMALTGVQEPISVGDNLSYGRLIFHIEQIEHRIQIEPSSGLKSFSTLLALSNGVPATGPLFPEIDVKREAVSQGQGFDPLQVISYSGLPQAQSDTTFKDKIGGS